MKKGQGAVLDALLLMMICAGAATLLLYVAQIYGSNSNKQILAIYNYEYSNTALLSLRFVEDTDGSVFWDVLRKKLACIDWSGYCDNDAKVVEIQDYFKTGAASGIFDMLTKSAPGNLVMGFEQKTRGSDSIYCYKDDTIGVMCKVLEPDFSESGFTTYAVSTILRDEAQDDWEVSMKIYF